jgi:MFS family permease
MATDATDAAAVAEEAPSPLRIPIFRAVWIASIVSNFGGMIQSVGAAWMMTSLSNSPAMVALVQSSTALPLMLLSLAAGAVADNWDRRLVMLLSQGFLLVTSIVLAVCAWAGVLTPWLLLFFTFLVGCGAAFNGPAWQSSVGEMVPRRALPAAVALNSMGFNIARSVGPAIGGAIVAAAGAATAFIVNAFTYVGLIVVLARWRPKTPPRLLPRETMGDAMAAGIRYVAMSPNLRIVTMRALLFGLTASAIPALMPVVARDIIGGGPLVFGFLLGAFGVGAVSGALLSSRLRGRITAEVIARGAIVAVAVGTAGAGATAFPPLTALALLIGGAGWVMALATYNVTVQLAAPRWVVARALAIYQTAAFAGMAAGSWGFGVLAEDHGIREALLIAAALQIAVLLIGLRSPLPEVDDLNLDLLSSWMEPDTAVRVEPRSGPIVVTIAYRIASENIVEFLNAMDERRRIRRRDGARHWTLLRDLGDPELWIERYHVPTWLDYVRHNQRRTHSDVENIQRVMALHIGPAKPEVHRMIERRTGSLPGARAPSSRELADPLTDPARSA